MMQRNVFFKARLLIPLCLWCVRFRHNNHLVRKKNKFLLEIPNCYGLPVKNIQFLTPWARLETVLSALANVELRSWAADTITYPPSSPPPDTDWAVFFLTFPPPTLAFCVCKLKNVRKYKSMAMYRFKLCRGQNSFGPDGSHRAVTTSSLLRVDRLKWVTFPQPATETWVLSAAHVLSISSVYSVWVLGHLNHFSFLRPLCLFFFSGGSVRFFSCCFGNSGQKGVLCRSRL